jgi:hypothetical protein
MTVNHGRQYPRSASAVIVFKKESDKLHPQACVFPSKRKSFLYRINTGNQSTQQGLRVTVAVFFTS